MRNKTENFEIHSIKFNFLMNVILKISQFVFPLITFPYVSRVLGADSNGKVGFASSFVSYFALVASLGIPSYGVRKCAEVRQDRNKLNQTVRELLTLNSICLVLTYCIFLLTVFLIPKLYEEKLLMLITSSSIIFNVLGVDWFFQAIEQYRYITIRNIIFKVIGIILMFMFVHSPDDYVIYSGIMVFASVGSNIYNILKLRKFISFKGTSISIPQILIHLSPVLMLFLYNATTTIFTNLDQVMLGFMKTDTIVGYYNASIKIKNILTGFITALGAVMLPRISFYLKNGEEKKFEDLIRKSFSFILVSSLPIFCYFTIEAEPVLLFISGEEYLPAIPIMMLLMPSIVFIGLSSVTAWQLLIPLKKEKITVLGAVLGAITDLIINVLLIPRLGAVGAAIGTTVAEGVVLLTHYFYLKDYFKRTFQFSELIKCLSASLIASLLLLGLDILLDDIGVFFKCVITSISFFGLFALLLFAFREKIIIEYGTRFLAFLSKKRG